MFYEFNRNSENRTRDETFVVGALNRTVRRPTRAQFSSTCNSLTLIRTGSYLSLLSGTLKILCFAAVEKFQQMNAYARSCSHFGYIFSKQTKQCIRTKSYP